MSLDDLIRPAETSAAKPASKAKMTNLSTKRLFFPDLAVRSPPAARSPLAARLALAALLLPLMGSSSTATAQEPPVAASAEAAPKKSSGTALQMVQAAVNSELEANRTDHSAWMYRDHDKTPDKDVVNYVVETPQGGLSRKIQDHGRDLGADQRHEEDERIRNYVGDTGAQAKARSNGQHDDAQAERLLRLLPRAFIWTIKSEHGDLVTINFEPDPSYSSDSMESHVLSTMAGEMVISRPQNRIQSLRGALVDDVKLGFGVLGRMRKGGTFNIERREIEPHKWQIVESHVHIDGRALFFKTIGSQEDEIKSGFKPSTAKTLTDAAAVLNDIR